MLGIFSFSLHSLLGREIKAYSGWVEINDVMLLLKDSNTISIMIRLDCC